LPEPFNGFGALPEGTSIQEAWKKGMQQFAQHQNILPDHGIAIWPESPIIG
jgi:hypothetical protein